MANVQILRSIYNKIVDPNKHKEYHYITKWAVLPVMIFSFIGSTQSRPFSWLNLWNPK